MSLELPHCKLPVIGRIDYEDQNNFIELKTELPNLFSNNESSLNVNK